MLTTSQKIMESLILGTLNILLPTAHCDIYLIAKLFSGQGTPWHEECSWRWEDELFDACIKQFSAENKYNITSFYDESYLSYIFNNTHNATRADYSKEFNLSVIYLKNPKYGSLLLGPFLIN